LLVRAEKPIQRGLNFGLKIVCCTDLFFQLFCQNGAELGRIHKVGITGYRNHRKQIRRWGHGGKVARRPQWNHNASRQAADHITLHIQ